MLSVIMPKNLAIMLNYAQVRYESYYAQNYAGIMCQGLLDKGGDKFDNRFHVCV